VDSPSPSFADPQSSAVSQPAEPCPTPLSTAEVFESFGREADSWEFAGPFGSIRGHSLGNGPPLYFLNGLEGTSEIFRLLAWLLREEFRCVLFDAPVPEAPVYNAIQDVSDLPDVRQLFAVADQLEQETFTVYGSGFGGWVTLASMLSDPERISGAFLQAAYAQRKFGLLERFLLALGRRSSRTFERVPGWQAVFQQNHRHWFPPFDAARFEIFRHIAGYVPVRDVSLKLRQLQKLRFDQRLKDIRQPVLLLKSEGEGRLHRGQQEVLEESLPHAQSEWLQNTGLVPHWTHPHRVAKLIRQFFDPTRETKAASPATAN